VVDKLTGYPLVHPGLERFIFRLLQIRVSFASRIGPPMYTLLDWEAEGPWLAQGGNWAIFSLEKAL